jgi:hypothetical protein
MELQKRSVLIQFLKNDLSYHLKQNEISFKVPNKIRRENIK